MELVIPDGAQVHITIGNTPLLALPNETAPQPDPIPPAQASVGERTPPVLPRAAAPADQPAAAEIPPAFRAKLAQPPQVAPSPGQAPVAAAGGPTPANPFGLHE